MANDYFRFKRFTVRQGGAAMKVGTDGVLIGAWFDLSSKPRAILDVGTGTGLIALMAAQRSEEWNARIDGIEIEPGSAEQARQNAEQSPWTERITVYHGDFIHFADAHKGKYDLVVSNPPYFMDFLPSPDADRNTVRHTQSLTYDALARGAAKVLNGNGIFSVIIPSSEERIMLRAAFSNDLHPRRKTSVRTLAEAEPKRVMTEFVKRETEYTESEIVIEERQGVFNAEYMALTNDFYLKF